MRICFIDSISTPYDGDTLKKRGLGGSESAIIYLARELVKQGFKVDVYNKCISDFSSPGNYDGVNYIDNSQTNAFIIPKYDVCICSRSIHPLYSNSQWPFASKSTYKVVWLHDTHIGQEADLERMLYHRGLDEIWTLSDYATMFTTTNTEVEGKRNFEFMKKYIWETRNGAHKWIDYVDPRWKDPELFVYNAAAQKGLDVLLHAVWPEIKKRIPYGKLTVVGGYYNYGAAENNHRMVDEARKNQDILSKDVTFTGIISQQEVAEIFAKASMFLYPTHMPETFGISTLESMLYSTPVITQEYGALGETAIDAACVKLPFSTVQQDTNILSEHERIQNFVETVVKLYDDQYSLLTKQYACSIVHDPEIYSWESVALQWKQRIYKKLNAYMSRDDFRKVSRINSKVNRVYNRRFVNQEITSYYTKCRDEQPIVVVSPFWNAEKYLSKHILSIAQQDYENYVHVLIDDCSEDRSYDVAVATIKSLPKNIQDKFKLIKNTERVGCIGNQLNIFEKLSDDAIVMLIDGDDWLINNNTIFNYYSELYHDGYDFTYGSSISFGSKRIQIGQNYPEEIIKRKAYKEFVFPWGIPYTHIRTFKGRLCNKLSRDVFKDANGNMMMAGADNPLFYELIERSENPYAVKEVFLEYNDVNPLNDFKINSEQQANNVRHYHGK